MSLDLTRLQTVLDGDTDILLRRDFAHPPAKVWRALTEPALIRQWMAVQDHPMTRCEFDPRPGGSFHFEWAGPDGNSFFFSGPVIAVDPPHHITHIEYFNGDTTSGARITTDLAPQGSGTRMTMVMRYESAEARAAAIATGMTDGMEEVYGKLDAMAIG
ncbi:SRPBCC domain-containing protein [Tabrizicola sp.]|uniref:SRPBCC family protein n=1 Tax=Tabrizicola sp. TaxID=2005166 RepID=UPI0025F18607|nr:SRPBCC domain-containing protein [Tabrizicola sp.]